MTGLAYPLDPEAVLASHQEAGIGAVWNLPYAHKAGVAEQLNRDIAALSDRLSGPSMRVVPGCTVHPADPDPAADLRRAVEGDGAKVLKLHCAVGSYTPDDPRLDPVWTAAAELGVPVVIHAGHHPAGTTAGAELDPLGRVLGRHPGATVILAHLGAPACDAAVRLMQRHPAMYADLTPVLRQLVDVDAGTLASVTPRLLFGTDAPNTGHRAADLLRRLDDLVSDEVSRRRIAGGTAGALVPL